MTGCHEARNAISIEEIDCPQCHEIMEVFIRDGNLYMDAVCESCRHRIDASTNLGDLKCG